MSGGGCSPGQAADQLGASARLRPPGRASSEPPGLESRVRSLPKVEQGETVLRFKIPSE